jgi:ABC transporter substrate binding protein
MKRREFITLLGGAAAVASSVSWPLVAQEQPGRMRRIGMLWIIAEIDPQATVNVTDPVGQGFVENLARPGGNATGFTLFEFSMGTKWLEILRELVPSVKKVGFSSTPPWHRIPGYIFARSNKVPSASG